LTDCCVRAIIAYVSLLALHLREVEVNGEPMDVEFG